MSLENDLLRIKKEIQESQNEKIKLEGQLEELKNVLLAEWGCKTLEEAEALIKKMESELEDSSEKLEEILNDLRKFGWQI